MHRPVYRAGIVWTVLSLFTAAGCGGRESGTVVTSDQAAGDTRPAQYRTQDGWTIQGDLYEPHSKSKGFVLLLHQRGGSADDWHALAIALQQAGYIAFAIDQRGTGRSAVGPGQSGDHAPWNTTSDIEGGVYALKDKGPITLIGASYGANNALLYAAAHPGQIRSLVLLSPSTDYHGLKTEAAVKKYTGALLIFHQKGDKIAGDGPEALNRAAGSKDHLLQMSEGTGHGVALLNPVTTQQTVDFVVRTLK